MRPLDALCLLLAVPFAGLVGCAPAPSRDGGADAAPQPLDGPVVDAREAVDASSANDAPPANDASQATPLRRCPTRGRGGVEGDECFVLTPAETGLPASGVNASVDQYALRPATGPRRGQLVLYLNGSGGSPRGGIASPATSIFSVARAQGLHVLAVSYRSDDTIASLCAESPDRDACFVQTRRSILLGQHQPGAARALEGIVPGEGVYGRALAALRALAERDPEGGWEAYFDRAALSALNLAGALRWERVITAGHSQGGGHAALLGRLHRVARVLVFASPCDTSAGAPAAWLTNDGSFATDPTTSFRGLGAPVDAICPRYAAAWEALRMSPAARDASAVVCAGEQGHGAPVACVENADRWARMLAP